MIVTDDLIVTNRITDLQFIENVNINVMVVDHGKPIATVTKIYFWKNLQILKVLMIMIFQFK